MRFFTTVQCKLQVPGYPNKQNTAMFANQSMRNSCDLCFCLIACRTLRMLNLGSLRCDVKPETTGQPWRKLLLCVDWCWQISQHHCRMQHALASFLRYPTCWNGKMSYIYIYIWMFIFITHVFPNKACIDYASSYPDPIHIEPLMTQCWNSCISLLPHKIEPPAALSTKTLSTKGLVGQPTHELIVW